MQSENKAEIIKKLGEAYALTFEPIERMVYLRDMYCDSEIVVVYGEEDKVLLEVNVHWDSGCAMINDVAKAVYEKLVLGNG